MSDTDVQLIIHEMLAAANSLVTAPPSELAKCKEWLFETRDAVALLLAKIERIVV